MAMPVPVAEIPLRVVFDDYEIQLDTGELTKAGERVKLAPQPAKVLALLVRRAGETVSREEIRAEIWNDGTVVEFDQGLNFCIRQIRSALGEDAKSPRYIETIPKRGYRFLRPVTLREETPAKTAAQSPKGSDPSPSPLSLFLIAGLALTLLAIFWPKSHQPIPPTTEAARLFQEAGKMADEGGDFAKAVQLYLRVTELAPDFAPGWAALGNLEATSLSGVAPSRSAKARLDAERHVRKALALDPSSAFAHAAMAHVYWHQWNWESAETEFRKALDQNPNEIAAHQLYGLYLASRGRKLESIKHARRAVELAPASGIVNFSLALVYYQAANFQEAIAQSLHTLEISRHIPHAYNVLVPSYARTGDLTAALKAQDESDRVRKRNNPATFDLPRVPILVRMGRVAEAKAYMELYEKQQAPDSALPLSIPEARIAFGNYDEAFASLRHAVDLHASSVIFLKSAPNLEPLRSDPRYRELLARMGNP